MNLYAKLLARQAERRPIRVGLIGAGKFGAMYLHQIPTHAGHPSSASPTCRRRARWRTWRVGWAGERYGAARSPRRAHGTTLLTDDWDALVIHGIDVIVECTGDPIAAVEHALAAFGTASAWSW